MFRFPNQWDGWRLESAPQTSRIDTTGTVGHIIVGDFGEIADKGRPATSGFASDYGIHTPDEHNSWDPLCLRLYSPLS